MVFGVISPKIRIKRVKIPVAAPAALFPKISVTSTVSMEDADKFTTLFPIKMALSILLLFSRSRITHRACLFPLSASVRMRILLTVVSAVSEEEKKAESPSKIKMIAIRMAMAPLSGSKILSLLFSFISKAGTGFSVFSLLSEKSYPQTLYPEKSLNIP